MDECQWRQLGERDAGIVDATELHEPDQPGDVRLERRAVHLVGHREGSVGDGDGRGPVASMHRRARHSHQRERSLHRHLGHREQFLGAALRSARLTEGDLGTQQRSGRLHQPELVLELLEPRPRLLGKVRSVGQIALPQPQIGEQRLHHSDGPLVAALVGLADHQLGQRLGLGEVSFEELDEREQTECPADSAAVTELVEGVGGVVEPVAGQAHVAGEEGDPRSMLFEPGQTALIVEQAIQRVGLAEEPFGVDQRPAEELDETAGPQGAGKAIGSVDRAQQIDGLTELETCLIESAAGVVHRAEQAMGVAFRRDVAALHCAGQRAVEVGLRRVEVAEIEQRLALISCSCTRSSSCSGPCGSSSNARLAWRTAVRRLPLSSARSAAAVSSLTASALIVLETPSTGPSSLTSSAAVAVWWARSSRPAGKVGHGLGDTCVARARPGGLGERLVRGVTNGVAAELPSPASQLQQTRGRRARGRAPGRSVVRARRRTSAARRSNRRCPTSPRSR